MHFNKIPNTLTPYLLLWIFLNLFQACFTELIHDEAYYWVWSRDLDWGYFDHPPMIALFIKIGYAVFQNELGVRLMIVLSNTATLWLIWKIIEGEKPLLFLVLAFSTIIIQVGGFIAVPDIPLVFFTAWFFYFLKKYLGEERESFNSWLYSFGLTLATLGMAYSKYQGVLVVLFAVLPNLRLMRRPSFWLIPILTLVCLIPHFHWQYLQEFPSFRYQLFDRSQVPYKIEFFWNYLLGQILIFGPFIGFLLFPAAVKFKAQNSFERTMKWCLYGFFGFFLIQSFRGRIEANWTVMAAIPLLYLAYHFIENRTSWVKWAYRLSIPSLFIILIFRFYLMVDFLPTGWNVRNEFHNWDKWAISISKRAGDKPVVFENSFQFPSKYMFYSGKFAHSINNFNYAGKQYDLMIAEEENLQGKAIYRIHQNTEVGDEIKVPNIKKMWGESFPQYFSFNRVKIKLAQENYSVPLDTILQIPIEIINPTDKEIDFSVIKEDLLHLEYCLFWYGKPQYCEKAIAEFPVNKLVSGEVFKTIAKISTPKEKGEHWRFRFSIHANWFYGRNSNFARFKILE